ncbi:MAG: putative glutathione S-transferase [Bacteroidia bacterium]|jgi:putative glutathione S-transferase
MSTSSSKPVSAPFPKESSSTGAFRRQVSAFRDWVTTDASSKFPAESGRYHLYVSSACPWAHRVIIARKLKGLEAVIGMTIVDPIRDTKGWAFTDAPDPLEGFRFLEEAYLHSAPSFEGRVTVPVLWDKVTRRIVNNESSEILRMLNSAFDAFTTSDVDLYPEPLRVEIDALNARIYDAINNGVYQAGFATTQAAYTSAVTGIFEMLEELEVRLEDRRFLMGPIPTEADWRLFTTLVRFDAVYFGHFKCNLRSIESMPNLWGYLRDLYQQPGVAETVDMDHIKRHYYETHLTINPTGIVPAGPTLDFQSPHGRQL